MEKGSRITIIPSIALTNMKLGDLANQEAVITELNVTEDGTWKGAWITLDGGKFNGESEWYIPASSIVQ